MALATGDGKKRKLEKCQASSVPIVSDNAHCDEMHVDAKRCRDSSSSSVQVSLWAPWRSAADFVCGISHPNKECEDTVLKLEFGAQHLVLNNDMVRELITALENFAQPRAAAIHSSPDTSSQSQTGLEAREIAKPSDSQDKPEDEEDQEGEEEEEDDEEEEEPTFAESWKSVSLRVDSEFCKNPGVFFGLGAFYIELTVPDRSDASPGEGHEFEVPRDAIGKDQCEMRNIMMWALLLIPYWRHIAQEEGLPNVLRDLVSEYIEEGFMWAPMYTSFETWAVQAAFRAYTRFCLT